MVFQGYKDKRAGYIAAQGEKSFEQQLKEVQQQWKHLSITFRK